MPFKKHKKKFFQEKKIIKKKRNVCLPFLNFSDPLPEMNFFLIWPNSNQILDPMDSENRDNLCSIPITMYENICFVRVKETVSQNLRLLEKRMMIFFRVNIFFMSTSP